MENNTPHEVGTSEAEATPTKRPFSGSAIKGLVLLILLAAALMYLVSSSSSAKHVNGLIYEYPAGLFSLTYPQGWVPQTIHSAATGAAVLGGVNILSASTTVTLTTATSTNSFDPAKDVLAGYPASVATNHAFITAQAEILSGADPVPEIKDLLTKIEGTPNVTVLSSNDPSSNDPSAAISWENNALHQKSVLFVRVGSGVSGKVSPVLFTVEYTAADDAYDSGIATTLTGSFKDGVIDTALKTLLFDSQIIGNYYAQGNQSFDGLCEDLASTTPDHGDLLSVLKDVSSAVACGDGSDTSGISAFAIEARMVNNPSQYFCIDSRGNAVALNSSTIDSGSHLPAADLVCGE